MAAAPRQDASSSSDDSDDDTSGPFFFAKPKPKSDKEAEKREKAASSSPSGLMARRTKPRGAAGDEPEAKRVRQDDGEAEGKLPSVTRLFTDPVLAAPSFLTQRSLRPQGPLDVTKSFDLREQPEVTKGKGGGGGGGGGWRSRGAADAGATHPPAVLQGSVGTALPSGRVVNAAAAAAVGAAAAMSIYKSPEAAAAGRTPAQKAMLGGPKGTKGDKETKDKSRFNEKEKRKRDLGQSSRGKSYVEEEKRLLNHSEGFGGDGFGFD